METQNERVAPQLLSVGLDYDALITSQHVLVAVHGQQRGEATPAPNQLVRRALFEDATVLDHDDAIGLQRR